MFMCPLSFPFAFFSFWTYPLDMMIVQRDTYMYRSCTLVYLYSYMTFFLYLYVLSLYPEMIFPLYLIKISFLYLYKYYPCILMLQASPSTSFSFLFSWICDHLSWISFDHILSSFVVSFLSRLKLWIRVIYI
jgi:hypothetical protein